MLVIRNALLIPFHHKHLIKGMMTVCIRIKRINDSFVEWVRCVNVENTEKKKSVRHLSMPKKRLAKCGVWWKCIL